MEPHKGGIVSPALANCALDGLEPLLQENTLQKSVSSPLEAHIPL